MRKFVLGNKMISFDKSFQFKLSFHYHMSFMSIGSVLFTDISQTARTMLAHH